jgi:hypothetical protein
MERRESKEEQSKKFQESPHHENLLASVQILGFPAVLLWGKRRRKTNPRGKSAAESDALSLATL